jgi:hypothetical protein
MTRTSPSRATTTIARSVAKSRCDNDNDNDNDIA